MWFGQSEKPFYYFQVSSVCSIFSSSICDTDIGLGALMGSTITQGGLIKNCYTVCYMFMFSNWMGYTQLFSYVFL